MYRVFCMLEEIWTFRIRESIELARGAQNACHARRRCSVSLKQSNLGKWSGGSDAGLATRHIQRHALAQIGNLDSVRSIQSLLLLCLEDSPNDDKA